MDEENKALLQTISSQLDGIIKLEQEIIKEMKGIK